MKCITFQKPKLYHLFFLCYFVSMFFREYLNDVLFENLKFKSGYFFRMYTYIISHLISFIPYFISLCLSKNEVKFDNNLDIHKSKNKTYIYNDGIKRYKGKYLIKPVLIVSLFGFFSEAVFYIFFLINNDFYSVLIYNLSIYLILNTVTIYLVSYFVLKTHFYKHHYLSLKINSICFVISLIFDIIRIVKLNIKQYSYYIYIVIRIIKLILLCFLFTYSKKVLNSCFLSPYSIIAFRSIYETIFLTIFSIPLCFIKVYDFKDGDEEIIIFKNFLKYLTGSNLIYSILMLIDDYLIDIFSMLIIDKFSPSHLTLAMILESFAHMGYKIISKNVKGLDIYWNQYANLGIYVILLIGSMIHNEILVINKWGLNAKIQKSLNNEFINEIDSDMDLNEECENDDEKEKKEMSNID